MLAVYAKSQSNNDPLSGLAVGQLNPKQPPEDWVKVQVRAAGLNHHDLWSLRGVGLPAERLPMVLGCDGAGVTADGREVIIHAVISNPQWPGDETEDPQRSLLSEVYPGTFAENVWVPADNLVDKPVELSFDQAACLPTAWLTAYRMLFTKAQIRSGETVVVQGAGGGVSTAAVMLAKAAGARVWVTFRNSAKSKRILQLGADAVFPIGERLPKRVDVVIDSVGQATWAHSLRSLRPGGRLVTCGATSGANPPAELNRVFFLQLQILGSTMGTRKELVQLAQFMASNGTRPIIDQVLPLTQARNGCQDLLEGRVFGKVIFRI